MKMDIGLWWRKAMIKKIVNELVWLNYPALGAQVTSTAH